MNQTPKYDLQATLIQEILSRFDSQQRTADSLAHILSINREASYPRIRNVTMLSPDEIGLLAREFGISVDNIIYDNERSILFSFNAFEQRVTDLIRSNNFAMIC